MRPINEIKEYIEISATNHSQNSRQGRLKYDSFYDGAESLLPEIESRDEEIARLIPFAKWVQDQTEMQDIIQFRDGTYFCRCDDFSNDLDNVTMDDIYSHFCKNIYKTLIK